jgi:hypothetical protein
LIYCIPAGDAIHNLAEKDSLPRLVFEIVEYIELPPVSESIKDLTAGELALTLGRHGYSVLCQTRSVVNHL